jgi:hypothetical protein
VESCDRSDYASIVQPRARARRAAVRQASGSVPASIITQSIGPASWRIWCARTSGDASEASRRRARRRCSIVGTGAVSHRPKKGTVAAALATAAKDRRSSAFRETASMMTEYPAASAVAALSRRAPVGSRRHSRRIGACREPGFRSNPEQALADHVAAQDPCADFRGKGSGKGSTCPTR